MDSEIIGVLPNGEDTLERGLLCVFSESLPPQEI
jgi:hypothetical protein